LASDNTPEEDRRWEKLATFFAQLTAASDLTAAAQHTDFSNWAFVAFKYAFGPWETPTSPTGIAIRAACLWYVYAGDKIWATVNGSEFWNRAYWDGWREHLVDAQATFSDEETKRAIEDALAQIKRLEREQ